MGYDFGFMRLAVHPDHFPFNPPRDYDSPLPPFTNLKAIGDLLLERKAFRPNGPDGEVAHHYWSDTPDDGSLYVILSENWIGVDTHAHWRYVLDLYNCIKELYPDLVIADPQSGDLHNSNSFDAFIDDSYQAES